MSERVTGEGDTEGPQGGIRGASSFLSAIGQVFVNTFVMITYFVKILFVCSCFIPVTKRGPTTLRGGKRRIISSGGTTATPGRGVRSGASTCGALTGSSAGAFGVPTGARVPHLGRGHRRRIVGRRKCAISCGSRCHVTG